MPNNDPMSVPGAKVTLPVSKVREGFDQEFIAAARKNFSNTHMQLGGDHALYYTTNFTEFVPAAMANPHGPVSELTRRPDPSLGALTYTLGDGTESAPLDAHLVDFNSRVQGMMILHKGDVVFEAFPGMRPEQVHIWASVAKSMVGTLLTMLELEGKLDTSKPITDYAPALRGSEWDTVPLIHAINMASGLDITEDAKNTMDPRSVFQRMLAADFGIPNADGVQEDENEVLRGAVRLPGEEPGKFARYSSVITKVLCEVVETVTQKTYTAVAEERIWSKIGARAPLVMSLSPAGLAIGYGAQHSTLEDLARYALIFTPSWQKVAAEPIVSPDVLRKMQTASSKEAYLAGDFTDHSWVKMCFGKDMPIFNSHQWDAVWEDGALFKHGNLYQGIYSDPARDVVGVFFSTSPVNLAPDLNPGYLRAAAKVLAGG
ncbi:serine hydrolase domain-containing protein [uncultured Roseibium sp.]|uniref:serine hydrolase domain-containing protein n=1 Tax=uncultured Roseibium sp. TaxID=1936171 RepID=UPI00262546D5|nr:serine hydrolase domain-containing protein [uncultured Roseibium sp.]